MELKKYVNKNVYIHCYNGNVYFGTITDYFYPEDNEDGKESIAVATVDNIWISFNEDDIKTIKIV